MAFFIMFMLFLEMCFRCFVLVLVIGIIYLIANIPYKKFKKIKEEREKNFNRRIKEEREKNFADSLRNEKEVEVNGHKFKFMNDKLIIDKELFNVQYISDISFSHISDENSYFSPEIYLCVKSVTNGYALFGDKHFCGFKDRISKKNIISILSTNSNSQYIIKNISQDDICHISEINNYIKEIKATK